MNGGKYLGYIDAILCGNKVCLIIQDSFFSGLYVCDSIKI